MNDILRDRLKSVAEDSILIAALTALFKEQIEKEQPQVVDEDDSLLGQKFRAYDSAKKLIMLILADLKNYRIVEKPTKTFHKEN